MIITFAWICVLLGLLAAGYGLHVTANDPKKFALENLSSLGSYAQGSVASLWSLGALFFLYATLLAQREQIAQQEQQSENQQTQFNQQFAEQKAQFKQQIDQQQAQFKQDMEKRKWENEQQDEQFKLQRKAVQLQNFESSFFQLLNMLSVTNHSPFVRSTNNQKFDYGSSITQISDSAAVVGINQDGLSSFTESSFCKSAAVGCLTL